MSMKRLFVCTVAATLSYFSNAQAAPEICGDGIDNDADGYADNGCYPTGVTGVCESPLSCQETGAVAPLTGQLVYREPADLAPRVPYGPSITLQRTFMSQYDPGYNDPSDTDLMAPLGYGWHHNFQSWIKLGSPLQATEVMLHFVTGQDVLFTESTDDATYQYYSPQVGFHYDYLRRNKSSLVFELRTLTGGVYTYGSTTPLAMLTTIADSVGNEIALTYHTSGCYDGQLKRVTDASVSKFLEFSYDTSAGEECMLRNVELYSKDGTTETVLAEVEYLHGSTYQLTRAYRVDVSVTRTATCASDPACEVARSYSYDTNDKLATIDDGDNDDVAKFYYLSGNAGKTVRIETSGGVVGYEYGENESDCVGSGAGGSGTCVYFHKANTLSCDTDSRCEAITAGTDCGGRTSPGTGTTGTCFRASRWLDISSPNEDLIDAVSSSCSDCGDTAEYDWEVGAGGAKPDTLEGTKDPHGIWTTYERNSDGLVTKMVENDDNPSSAPRITYYLYANANFPGLVTEVRRRSEISSGSSCTASLTTDCKRTIYSYTADGLLDTLQEKGFTYNSSAAIVAYDFTSDWDYDSAGRVTKYKGPRTDTSYDVTDLEVIRFRRQLLTTLPS